MIYQPGRKLEDFEKQIIMEALIFYGQNKVKAASALGVSVKTIQNKLKQYQEEQDANSGASAYKGKPGGL